MTILQKESLSDRKYDVFQMFQTVAISMLIGFGSGLIAAYLILKITT